MSRALGVRERYLRFVSGETEGQIGILEVMGTHRGCQKWYEQWRMWDSVRGGKGRRVMGGVDVPVEDLMSASAAGIAASSRRFLKWYGRRTL